MPANDARTKLDLPADQQHYFRKAGSTKVTRLFSEEQMLEMVEDGRITEEDFVGITITREGYGGKRNTTAVKVENRFFPLPSSPWYKHNPANA